jgi:hypothetical protein
MNRWWDLTEMPPEDRAFEITQLSDSELHEFYEFGERCLWDDGLNEAQNQLHLALDSEVERRKLIERKRLNDKQH